MLVALLVCLIPTTIGALLSAIGIAGMDRLVQRNVLAMSGSGGRGRGDCSTLLLDKTGTITSATARPPSSFRPRCRRERPRRSGADLEPGRRDPEGRSIVTFAEEQANGKTSAVSHKTTSSTAAAPHARDFDSIEKLHGGGDPAAAS